MLKIYGSFCRKADRLMDSAMEKKRRKKRHMRRSRNAGGKSGW